jgi:hypothetical protein
MNIIKRDRNDRTCARNVAHRPCTAKERSNDVLMDRMLLMCRVNHDDDLPQVYHEWAACPCGVSDRYILQQSFDLAAAILEVPSFEITPTQVMTFKNFRYAGSGYFDIGSGLLPFSITPSESTYVQARAMLAADHVRVDAFDLGADPMVGAVAPGEVTRLQNISGYIPQTWNEALSQLVDMQAFMGALLGPAQHVMGVYGLFLWRYIRMLTRLEFEIDHTHGRCLGPSMMTFHVQLAWCNWMVVQLDSGEIESIDPPDFGTGLAMLETHQNLMWLPSVTNVPLLVNLSLSPGAAVIHVPAPVPASARPPAAARASAPAGGAPRRYPRLVAINAILCVTRLIMSCSQETLRSPRAFEISESVRPSFWHPPPPDGCLECCYGAYVCVVAREGAVL